MAVVLERPNTLRARPCFHSHTFLHHSTPFTLVCVATTCSCSILPMNATPGQNQALEGWHSSGPPLVAWREVPIKPEFCLLPHRWCAAVAHPWVHKKRQAVCRVGLSISLPRSVQRQLHPLRWVAQHISSAVRLHKR